MDDQVEEIRDLLCVSRLSYSAIDDDKDVAGDEDVPRVALSQRPFHRSSSYPFHRPSPPPAPTAHAVKSNSAKARPNRILSPLHDTARRKHDDNRPRSGPLKALHPISRPAATPPEPSRIATKQQAALPSIQPVIKTEVLESLLTRVDIHVLGNYYTLKCSLISLFQDQFII